MTESTLTVQQIVDRCGGADALAPRAKRSVWAVYKWFSNGIPEKHWDLIRELAGVSVDQIYEANRSARFRQEISAEAAA